MRKVTQAPVGPYVVASTVSQRNTTGPVTLPAYSPGDILLALVSDGGGSPQAGAGWVSPGSWYSYYRYMFPFVAKDPASATNSFYASNGSVLILTIRGANTANPVNKWEASTGSSVAESSIPLPAITTTVDNCLAIGFWGIDNGTAIVNANMTLHGPSRNTTANVYTAFLGSAPIAVAGTSPAGTFTGTVTNPAASGRAILAIAPA